MNRIFRNTIFYLLIFLVIIGVISFFNGNNDPTKPLKYSEFIEHLEAGDIKTLNVQPVRGVYEVRGTMKGKDGETSYLAYVWDDDTIKALVNEAANKKKAEVDVLPAEETSGWVTFFTSMIPFIIIFILFFFLINQAQGGGSRVMNFGKSKANLYTDDKK